MAASEISEAFERTCRDRRADLALIWLPDSRSYTFAELHEQYRRTRAAFDEQGLGPGCLVASWLGNRPEFFTLFIACMDAGAALLPVGEATDAEAVAILRNSQATAFATDHRLPAAVTGHVTIGEDVTLSRVDRDGTSRSYDPSVVIKLTSGSTDLPKATVSRERALLDDTRSIMTGMDIGPRDVNLALIPLSHAYAISNIVVPLVQQGTAAALRPAFHPARFVEDARTSGATVFPGVPFMFDRLRETLAAESLPAGLRKLVTAGAPIDPKTVQWFHDRARRKIHSFYGTSETGGITFDETDEVAEPLHVGRPLPGVTVELRPEAGLAAGGRVFVRARGMAKGYLTWPEGDEPSPFQDGGFRTNDLGYVDVKGQLVLCGRVSPLVNVAGRKVDPSEVERVLTALPQVSDARVVGVECQTRGQELVAFVVRADPSATPLALRQACAATLSPYKIPRRFIFLERWPVTPRGKIDRRELEALAAGSDERDATRGG